MKLATALVLLVAACSSACGGDSQTYSLEETKVAFALHGYTLVTPGPAQFPTVPEGVRIPKSYLAPKNDPSFVAIVASDSEADEAWPAYEQSQDVDSFAARRANVVVASSDGHSARGRSRVRAALAALPDRGSSVEVAGG